MSGVFARIRMAGARKGLRFQHIAILHQFLEMAVVMQQRYGDWLVPKVPRAWSNGYEANRGAEVSR
jgi:hypothetical protein